MTARGARAPAQPSSAGLPPDVRLEISNPPNRSSSKSPPVPSLHVLHVINQLGQGGAERSLASLSGPLRDHGIVLTVCCLKPPMADNEALLIRDAELIHLPCGGIINTVRKVHQLIKQLEVDVIHTTLFDADLVGRLASVGTGVPVLTSLVNTSYERVRLADPRVTRLGFYGTWLIDMSTGLLLTDHFHAISHAVERSAMERLHIPRKRLTVIERGRAESSLGERTVARRQRTRASLGIADNDYVVINVARQEFQKGQRHLLRAVKQLLESGMRLKLLLVGRSGHVTDELTASCAHSPLRENVHMLGVRADIADLLCAADVFAFPSLYEGLGGALLEAMALDLPIVASDLPAIREVLADGECGILTPPGDSEALAKALESVAACSHSARQLAQRARREFEARFTVERSAARLATLYRQVAAGLH